MRPPTDQRPILHERGMTIGKVEFFHLSRIAILDMVLSVILYRLMPRLRQSKIGFPVHRVAETLPDLTLHEPGYGLPSQHTFPTWRKARTAILRELA